MYLLTIEDTRDARVFSTEGLLTGAGVVECIVTGRNGQEVTLVCDPAEDLHAMFRKDTKAWTAYKLLSVQVKKSKKSRGKT